MGVPTKTVSIQDGRAFMERLFDEFHPGTYCLAMSADTLSVLNKASISGAALQSFIDGYFTELLVFGYTSSTEQGSALSPLTAGAVSGIRPLGDQAVRFALPREAMLP